MLKTGKQMKLELFKNYKITTGTIDNKNPKAMTYHLKPLFRILKPMTAYIYHQYQLVQIPFSNS